MIKSRIKMMSGNGSEKIFRTGYRLTPHPGPLPIEGRGGATSGVFLGDTQRRARFVLVVRADLAERNPTRREAAVSRFPSLATPSPLNGERAGVRGEKVRCAFPSWVLKATITSDRPPFSTH